MKEWISGIPTTTTDSNSFSQHHDPFTSSHHILIIFRIKMEMRKLLEFLTIIFISCIEVINPTLLPLPVPGLGIIKPKLLLKPKFVWGAKNILPFPLFPIVVGDPFAPLREAAAFGAGAVVGNAGGSVAGAVVGSKATKLLKYHHKIIKPVPVPLPLPLPLPLPFPVNLKFPRITVSKETVEDYPRPEPRRREKYDHRSYEETDHDEYTASSSSKSSSSTQKKNGDSVSSSSSHSETPKPKSTKKPMQIRITFGAGKRWSPGG